MRRGLEEGRADPGESRPAQFQLAEMIGRSQSAVSQIEHGEIALSLDMLRQIVAQLGGEVEITAVFKDRRVLLDA